MTCRVDTFPTLNKSVVRVFRKLHMNYKLWFRLQQICYKKTAVSGVVFSVSTDGYILISQYMLIGWK